jgi:hypothetical protein
MAVYPGALRFADNRGAEGLMLFRVFWEAKLAEAIAFLLVAAGLYSFLASIDAHYRDLKEV